MLKNDTVGCNLTSILFSGAAVRRAGWSSDRYWRLYRGDVRAQDAIVEHSMVQDVAHVQVVNPSLEDLEAGDWCTVEVAPAPTLTLVEADAGSPDHFDHLDAIDVSVDDENAKEDEHGNH
jgi:hypothetical protein